MMTPDPSDALLEPIRHQPRLPEIIARRIEALIDGGELGPGDRLPTEAQLAEQLGVGRTSVREALQTLQAHGAIEVRKGLGAFVRQTRPSPGWRAFAEWIANSGFPVTALAEVRLALETLASALAATRAGDEERAAIVERHEAHRAATRREVFADILMTDEAFHQAVIEAGHNSVLERLYGNLVGEVREFRRETLLLDGAPERSAAGHQAIVDAILARDPGAARAAMIAHLWVLYDEINQARDPSATDPGTTIAPRESFG